MIKKLLRELYLLPTGEQRAMILISLLLILSLAGRLVVQMLPGREPAGMEDFAREAGMVLAALSVSDSLEQVQTNPEHMRTRTEHAPLKPGPPYIRDVPIDINRTDSIGLLPLPGIGPVYAGRIIKYRNLLGGFVQVDQLNEVYGLPASTVELIREQIHIDTLAIRKIFPDSATFRELLRHPYLDMEEVKALVQYRDFRGGIHSMEELYKDRVLPDSILNRVAPYFKFRWPLY